jgi:hypothetical protein
MTVWKSVGDGGGMKKLQEVSQIGRRRIIDEPGVKYSSQKHFYFCSCVMQNNDWMSVDGRTIRLLRLWESGHITENGGPRADEATMNPK